MAKKKDTEKVHEIFEIEKEGKEKIVEKDAEVKKKHSPKKELEKQNKILRNVLISLGILLAVFLIGYYSINSIRFFEHRGVDFEVVNEGTSENPLILYRTGIPIMHNGQPAEYNIYFRKDPRKVEKQISLDEFTLFDRVIINLTGQLTCEGDRRGDTTIAVANLVNLYDVYGIKIMKDENASCDTEGKLPYTYINIQETNNPTNIERTGPSCYNFNVNNCEILEATERFMVETIVKIQEKNGS